MLSWITLLKLYTRIVAMANQGFIAVHFLFTLYSFSLLNVALLVGPPPPPGAPPSALPKSIRYYGASLNGDLGVRFTFDPPGNKAMHIIISYSTEADPVKTFFTKQLTQAVFDKFAKCPTVTMFFLPCSMSKVIRAHLSCPLGKNQCYLDKFHACVASNLKDDRVTLAKFILCTFSGKTAEQCRNDNKIIMMATCVKNGDGEHYCDGFHNEIESEKKKNPSNNPEKKLDATTDFVNVVCSYLAEANLRCEAGCT